MTTLPTSLAERPLSDLSDLEIADLTQQIKSKSASERPLVGQLEPLSALEKEYQTAAAETYLAKIKSLEHDGWKSLRRLRGDGDCFYRAFAYAYIERLVTRESIDAIQACSKLDGLLPLLDQAGYSKIIYEDFYDPLRNLVNSFGGPNRPTAESILASLNDAEVSNSIVVFLRLLTSAYLRAHSDDFIPFLFGLEDDPRFFEGGAPTLDQFCSHYVEAVNQEADHIQITALTRALGVKTSIAYLDQSGGGGGGGGEDSQLAGHDDETTISHALMKVDFHQFEQNESVALDCALLYRPGHYDCMYK